MRDSGDNTGSSIKREEGFVEAQKYLREVSDDIHLLQAAMHELGRTCPLMSKQTTLLHHTSISHSNDYRDSVRHAPAVEISFFRHALHQTVGSAFHWFSAKSSIM